MVLQISVQEKKRSRKPLIISPRKYMKHNALLHFLEPLAPPLLLPPAPLLILEFSDLGGRRTRHLRQQHNQGLWVVHQCLLTLRLHYLWSHNVLIYLWYAWSLHGQCMMIMHSGLNYEILYDIRWFHDMWPQYALIHGCYTWGLRGQSKAIMYSMLLKWNLTNALVIKAAWFESSSHEETWF